MKLLELLQMLDDEAAAPWSPVIGSVDEGGVVYSTLLPIAEDNKLVTPADMRLIKEMRNALPQLLMHIDVIKIAAERRSWEGVDAALESLGAI